ncbi:uncharacterized protein M8220_015224 [Acridotheres tristis]
MVNLILILNAVESNNRPHLSSENGTCLPGYLLPLCPEPSRPDSRMAEGPSSVPGQPLSSDCAWSLPDPIEDLTEDQEYTQKHFSCRAQNFWKFNKYDEREEITIAAIEGMVRCDSYNAEACAAVLDLLAQTDTSSLKHVPTTVKFIHRWLVSNKDVCSEHRLDKSLLELTHTHPSDVVVTPLCSASSCERQPRHCGRSSICPCPQRHQ